MKKLVITTLSVVALAGSVFAQGTVNWGTLTPTAMNAQTNGGVASTFGSAGAATGGAQGATSIVGGSFYYTLLYTAFTGSLAATPTTMAQLNAAGWQSAGLLATNNTTTAGRLSTQGPNFGTGATVPWANGVTNSIMMAGWSAGLGTTWAAASANLVNWATVGSAITLANGTQFFGLTSTGFLNPGTANPGVAVFSTTTAQPQGTIINGNLTQLNQLVAAVPEPGTMVLAGLGGLAMLGLRRKK